MHWSRPLTGLVVLALVGLTVGALWRLTGALSTTGAMATMVVVAAAVVLASLVGTRTGRGLSTPYW